MGYLRVILSDDWEWGEVPAAVVAVARNGDKQTYVPERTAAVVVSHGSHGPEPRFPGDVWTMHHVCSACGGAVDGGDGYCKHCGARLADNHEKE